MMALFDRFVGLFCRHGHTLPTRQGNHLFLRCLRCGHESAGWRLDAEPPVRRF